MFNPKVKDFIEDKNPTVIGLYWAGAWRFTAYYLLFWLFLGLVILLVA